MGKLIILEGANGLGKTTLTKNLDLPYIHFPTGYNNCSEIVMQHRLFTNTWGLLFRKYPQDLNAQNYARLDILCNLDFINNFTKKNDLVCDRFLLSNLIYSRYFNEKLLATTLRVLTCEVIFIVFYTENSAAIKDRIISRDKQCQLTQQTMQNILGDFEINNYTFKNFEPKNFKIHKICIDGLDQNQLKNKVLELYVPEKKLED